MLFRQASSSLFISDHPRRDSFHIGFFLLTLDFGEIGFPLVQATIMRSMVVLVIAILVAGSATADAHHMRKQGAPDHRRHFFDSNVHHQTSVVQHLKASPVSVEQHVETSPLQPTIDFSKGVGVHLGRWSD